MIKFFRKIRQKMLTENKFSKYLLYAIGEIILVVIGILIALWINNWNQEQILTKQTDALLHNMVLDLKTDTTQFDYNIIRLEKNITGGKLLLQNKPFESISADSLYDLLPTDLIYYRITSQTFEKFKSIGLTKIGDSQELFNGISSYYTNNSLILETLVNYDKNESIETNNLWVLDDEFEAPSFDEGFGPYLDNEIIRKNTLVKLVSSIKSRNHIRQTLSRKSLLVRVIKSRKKDAESLISSIQEELNKK